MLQIIVAALLILTAGYVALGFLITVLVLNRALAKIDEGAHGAGLGFRLVIIPGCMVFWPVLLKKWLQVKKEKSGTVS